jgi:hypothetical protein
LRGWRTIITTRAPGAQSPWWLRLIERIGEIAQRPSQLRPGQLLVLLIHYLELAAVALAVLLALVAVGRGLRLMLRRRAATRSVRVRILLPEQFDREGLVGFFRTLSSLLRPRLGVPSWVSSRSPQRMRSGAPLRVRAPMKSYDQTWLGRAAGRFQIALSAVPCARVPEA